MMGISQEIFQGERASALNITTFNISTFISVTFIITFDYSFYSLSDHNSAMYALDMNEKENIFNRNANRSKISGLFIC